MKLFMIFAVFVTFVVQKKELFPGIYTILACALQPASEEIISHLWELETAIIMHLPLPAFPEG
jgi:hypothetical protein